MEPVPASLGTYRHTDRKGGMRQMEPQLHLPLLAVGGMVSNERLVLCVT